MNAIQNIEYYMMIEVIEPTWHTFVEKIECVENVDEVLLVHQDFLDDCLHNCMLKDPELLRLIGKLCDICLSFCKFIQVCNDFFWFSCKFLTLNIFFCLLNAALDFFFFLFTFYCVIENIFKIYVNMFRRHNNIFSMLN